jgi:hypothetical protein
MIKRLMPATKDYKTYSSIYVYNSTELKPVYLRRYQVLNDNRVYVVDLSKGELIKTDIKNLDDMDQIKKFDNDLYGDAF